LTTTPGRARRIVLDLLCWRAAHDTPEEATDVERTIRLLRVDGVSSRRIPVDMLAGAEPCEVSMDHARQIVLVLDN
jgi:hypothetical protein